MATTSFNWGDYLTLAISLSANPDEASQRSAISRAYYSAFHAATIHAQANGYSERNHRRLWKMYHSDTDLNSRRLSAIGDQMKQAREEADYAAQVARVGDVMTDQLARATQFASLPTSSPRFLPDHRNCFLRIRRGYVATVERLTPSAEAKWHAFDGRASGCTLRPVEEEWAYR
jgi:uncharacterized protein (UPF0332 family)